RITDIPIKKFFIKEGEVLFYFKKDKIISNKEKQKKRVIFGLRKCDLNALKVIDKIFYDYNYLERRKNTILIGIFCDKPDEFCFCNSMELEEYYDLFFYPYNENYIIKVGSKKGESLVKNLRETKEAVIPQQKNYLVLKNKEITKDYFNPLWKNDSEKCLSCTACTINCPTCNCFDIKDINDIEFSSGRRVRNQTSCLLKSFTEVAGGKCFRDSRIDRFKHFVYHKIVFFKKKFGRYMCVGCGRCLRSCPMKINWVETINNIKFKESIKNV
ncbi:MAG: 4Fe-4S dicluster domain-containing protein, partial [Candidatus Pacearchaeota archaeon]